MVNPEVGLGLCVSLLCCFAIPFYGFGIILRDTEAVVEGDAEVTLGDWVALFGCFAKPF